MWPIKIQEFMYRDTKNVDNSTHDWDFKKFEIRTEKKI